MQTGKDRFARFPRLVDHDVFRRKVMRSKWVLPPSFDPVAVVFLYSDLFFRFLTSKGKETSIVVASKFPVDVSVDS